MVIERQGLKEVILAKMGQTLGQMPDSPRDAVYMRVRKSGRVKNCQSLVAVRQEKEI
jgi:hypothetical protein